MADIEIYRQMLRIRKFEEKGYELFNKGIILGSLHTSIGQEAVAVGVCNSLRAKDILVSNHRGHGHAIAKGADTKRLLSELCGKQTGYCRGLGGSMHVAAFDKGVAGSNGIVGAGLPIATGLALASKLKGTGGIVVVFFGEGASNEGTFHESMNMASIWELPILFVCENNGYAVTMNSKRSISVEQISSRASSYGFPGETVDGMDVTIVSEAAQKYIERAREGKGPALLECITYRFMGHSRGDPQYGPYRTKEEWEQWKARDPLTVFAKNASLASKSIREIEKEVNKEIEEAEEFALQSPEPDPTTPLPVYSKSEKS